MPIHNPVTLCGVNPKSGEIDPIQTYSSAIGVMDYGVVHAMQIIKDVFGDNVNPKPKSLFKFGRTINTAGSQAKTTIAEFQGGSASTVFNETFATSNSVDRIVSSNASDMQPVTIEGHTLTDGNLAFVSQTVTLNGQTPVALSTPLARCNRLFNGDGSNLVGNVYVYDSTLAGGVTAGVPNTEAATKCMITAGFQQSEKGATSISSSDYYVITEIFGSLNRSSGGAQDVQLQIESRQIGHVFLPKTCFFSVNSQGNQAFSYEIKPPVIIPKNSDLRMVCYGSAADLRVTAGFNGYLCLVDNG